MKLDDVWDDTDLVKVCHNAKFDIGMTERCLGKSLRDHTIHCTYIMSALVLPDKLRKNLAYLSWELFGYPRESDEIISKAAKKCATYKEIPRHIMDEYQKHDAIRTMLLFRYLFPKLQKNPTLVKLYANEIELMWTTLEMERRGIKLSTERCRAGVAKGHKTLVSIQRELETVAWPGFNPGSTKQKARLLYEDLRLPVLRKTPTGLGATDKATINTLYDSHPHIPGLNDLVKYNAVRQTTSMFTSYLKHADEDDIIHPSINTCGANTGRESCSDPNLQNVKAEKRLGDSKAIEAGMPAVRTVFVPRDGFITYHVDYSGIEMRLLVHYSDDEEMIKIFSAGQDPHAEAAKEFYGDIWTRASDSERKLLREDAKNANYGICYGAGADKILKILKILDEFELNLGLIRYGKRFPRILSMSSVVGLAVALTGQVNTIFGRFLPIPVDQSYTGVAYLIQSTAADIMKHGKNRVHKILKPLGGHLLLSIHDELVFEVPEDLDSFGDRIHHPVILKAIAEAMTDFDQFKVPMKVDFKRQIDSWANTEDVEYENGR